MPIFNRTAFNNAVFNTGIPAPVATKKPRGFKPVYDRRIILDDEEVMDMAAMIIVEMVDS